MAFGLQDMAWVAAGFFRPQGLVAALRLLHRLGFRRDALVRLIGLWRCVPLHGLGFRRGAAVISVIRERWGDRFANKTEMATPSKLSV